VTERDPAVLTEAELPLDCFIKTAAI